MNLKFLNGSIASIVYSSNGNNDLAKKEYIEVYSGGKIGVVNDFICKLIGSKSKK